MKAGKMRAKSRTYLDRERLLRGGLKCAARIHATDAPNGIAQISAPIPRIEMLKNLFPLPISSLERSKIINIIYYAGKRRVRRQR